MTGRAPTSRPDVCVYMASPPYDAALLAKAITLLSPSEGARHARLHSSADRNIFAVAHGLLRAVIARHAGVPAAAVIVTQRCAICGGDHGRPVAPLGTPGAGLRLSLAHTRS